MNMHIYAAQTAPVVYLNGTILFVGGIAIVQAQTRWIWGWPLLVTLTGWGGVLIGLFRMAAPDAAQAESGPSTTVIFISLLVLGALLSWVGYRPGDRSKA